MGNSVTIFNRSQRRFSGLKLSGGKSFDLDSGNTIELEEKDAAALIRLYPRDLVKASEVNQGKGELAAKAGELSKREAELTAKETSLAAKEGELAAKADELSKREMALKKAEENK